MGVNLKSMRNSILTEKIFIPVRLSEYRNVCGSRVCRLRDHYKNLAKIFCSRVGEEKSRKICFGKWCQSMGCLQVTIFGLV